MGKENKKKKEGQANNEQRYRNSATGRFVSKSYANQHPKTTQSETIKNHCSKKSDPKEGTQDIVRRNKKK